MPVTLTIRDETTSGDVYGERPLEFPTERITVRDLIRERVYQEVQDFNRDQGERVFRGLVQPTDAERVLNGKPTEYPPEGAPPDRVETAVREGDRGLRAEWVLHPDR